MKLVKIKINNRVERILNFDEPNQLHNNHYIIRDGDIGSRELFRISQNAKLITGGKEEPLTITDITENGNVLDVIFGETKVSDTSTLGRGIKKLLGLDDSEEDTNTTVAKELTLIDGYYVLSKPKPKDSDHYELKFNLDDKSISIFLYYAQSSETFDAIIDFGSEASQASWRNSDENHIEFVNLTESILQQCNLSKNADDFVQFESETLYKSIYYIKKDLGSFKIDVWPNYKENALKFLVANDEEISPDEYWQLPNSKLFSFDISKYAQLKVKSDNTPKKLKQLGEKKNTVERLLMNNIVLQVLRDIKENTNEENAYIVLNILMPNVYPIHVTSQKLNQLAEDIAEFLNPTTNSTTQKDGTEQEDYSSVKAVELRAVSESDASLLGYINSQPHQTIDSGKYLIMDAGKGTLDFSIMERINANQNVCPNVNRSRAGIIGAGNAITYGLIIGLVNDYLHIWFKDYKDKDFNEKHKLIQKFIYKRFIEKTDASSADGKTIDVAKFGKLLIAIEEYKKVYNELYPKQTNCTDITPKSDEGVNSIDMLDITKFTQWIENLTTNKKNLNEESRSYVTAEIESIVNATIGKLIDMTQCSNPDDGSLIPVRGVVFTGRGFLMKELQEKMQKRLLDCGIANDKTDFKLANNKTESKNSDDEEAMKNVCLKIHQLLLTDKYDASPSRQTIGVFHRSPDNNRNDINTDKKTSQEEEEDPEYGTFGDGYFYPDENDNHSDSSTGDVESEGIPITKVTNDSSIIISGRHYGIPPRFAGKKQCRLYFDGIQYLLTAEGTESQNIATAENDPSSSSLGFESLFPNLLLKDESRVKIPTGDGTLHSVTMREANTPTDEETSGDELSTNANTDTDEEDLSDSDSSDDSAGQTSDNPSDSENTFGLAEIKEWFKNLFNK